MSSLEPIDTVRAQQQLPLVETTPSRPVTASPPEQERYTAAVFLRDRPDDYQDVFKRIARGEGLLKIADDVGVGVHVVIAIRDANPVAIATERLSLAGRMRAAAGLAVEAIIEDMSDPFRRKRLPADRKAVVAGVMTQNAELLSGGATARIEHIFDAATVQDFNRYIDAECHEAETAMHLGGRTPGQRDGGEASAGGARAPGQSEQGAPAGVAGEALALPAQASPEAGRVIDLAPKEDVNAGSNRADAPRVGKRAETPMKGQCTSRHNVQ